METGRYTIYDLHARRQAKDYCLPSHPVIFELFNPQGQLYSRHVKTSGINGFYSVAIPTGQEIPTGNWNLKVKAGGTVFEKILKIETIKPNRLKINLDFVTDFLTANVELSGYLQVNWLQGPLPET